MALTTPVARSVEVTAAKSYVVTVALCNTSGSSSFSAYAVPVLTQSYQLAGFPVGNSYSTSNITLVPGNQSQYIASRRTASTLSSTQYAVFAYRPSTQLTCSRNGTAVNVTIPFGTSYKKITNDELSLENSPASYRYSVTYGSGSNYSSIVYGTINVNINPRLTSTATTASASPDFSVCGVSVQ